MTAGSSAGGRAQLTRWLIATGIGFLSISSFVFLQQFFSRKFHLATGDAQWIRPARSLGKTAAEVFFVSRAIDVPADRQYVRVKIAAMPEYSVTLNGREVATSASKDRTLDIYDVTGRATPGRNDVSIAIRDPRGAGAVLAAIDYGHTRENVVVTDSSWKITLAPDRSDRRPHRLLGAPPAGPWDYPKPQPRNLIGEREEIVKPAGFHTFASTMPAVRVVSGVSILTAERVRAHAFDFGVVRTGRLRLRRTGGALETVRFRLLGEDTDPSLAEGTVRATVFAEGERSVTAAESFPFRWAVIYTPGVSAEIVTAD